MKKKYLIIEVIRNSHLVSESVYLLSDNIAAWLGTESEGLIRLYFKQAIPFSYITIYLKPEQLKQVVKGFESFTIERENSKFIYSAAEF